MEPTYTKLLNSDKLIAWFAPNIVLKHEKLVPLPLGNKWNWHSASHHGEDDKKSIILQILTRLASNPENNFRHPKTNLLFVRMEAGTNDNPKHAPTKGHRRKALAAARKVLEGRNSTHVLFDEHAYDCASKLDNEARMFADYMFAMRQYKYVLSPPGNGPDTHRTWEALLMGSIPIVERSAFEGLYADLPVLVVDDWDTLSFENLTIHYERFRNGVYNWDKLFAPYYFQQITSRLLAV